MSHYLFTITVPMYNAAPYLRATLRSLAWQRYPAAGVQIILVDDGSDDDSAAIADAWAAGRANVTVIQAPHRGVGAARNEALAIAEGEWFASVDADDILDRDYLAEVDHLLARDARGVTSAVCTRLWVLNEETGRWTDTHALGGKFHHGDRLVALQDEPEAFVLSSTTFLRTSVLRAGHLTFDPAVRPTFEDGHLIGRYLACFDDPVLAIATKARYYYRRRTIAKDSLTQTTWSRDGNYTSAPESGYLGMLRAVTERRGETPVWAQYMVLYNIMWYLVEEQSMESKTAWVEGDLARRFLATLGEIMSYIDRTTIEQFPYPRLTWIMRQAILVRFKDQVSAPRVFQLARTGETARAFLLCHGPVPPLVARTDAGAREVVVTGTRSHLYFGEEWMCELALAWPCPGTDDTVLMGGRPARYLDIRRWHPRAGAPSRHKLAPDLRAKRSRIALVLHRLWRRLEVGHVATGRSYGTLLVRMVCGGVGTVVRRWHEAARERWAAKAKARATTPAVQARYGGAWLVMDRPKLADDNGEHLYRYLLRTRPDLNAFFLLDRSSPHWSRLEAEGFRLLAYGSDAAVLATLNAVVRISS
ncbi:MAG: glycosyltransferase family 2 protein, partial [Propionibacteriaceae bacterium]|nr:glycosyltransferase family 2 protein [Propionibacteriaceae bacterium]